MNDTKDGVRQVMCQMEFNLGLGTNSIETIKSKDSVTLNEVPDVLHIKAKEIDFNGAMLKNFVLENKQ